MVLAPGTRLGSYEIVSLLDAGGMGEVYRARDPHLGRDVAIKVLRATCDANPDLIRRFEQEARAAAMLNHPNIVTVHEIGTHGGQPYVVSELLVGQTVRATLADGPLPVHKVIDYGVQICRGLAAAHEKGIVHRDLKPENLFVTTDRRVKILDFGLAKLMEGVGAATDITRCARRPDETSEGLLLGTVGYMSPEQVRAEPVDCRSDIFSLGAVIREMTSGERTFRGTGAVETLNAILKDDPPELPPRGNGVPASLDRIVRHCLEKDPADRFQSVRDLAFALTALSSPSGTSQDIKTAIPAGQWRWARTAAEALLLGIALTVFFAPRNSQIQLPQLTAAILPPPGEGFWANITEPAAISPDGRFLALVAMRNGSTHLWLRRLDTSDAQPIGGTDGATNPFWSPDSHYVAFFAGTRLKKVDVSGGTVSDICPIGTYGMGGSWSSRGVIIFSSLMGTVRQIPDAGGTPESVAGTRLSNDALGQYWPVFLPDGTHFIYLEWQYGDPRNQVSTVWVASLDGESPKRLPLVSTNVQYAFGHLLFSRDGDLVAQRFDLRNFELSGSPLTVARHIEYDSFFNDASFTASTNGMVVYAPAGTGVDSELTWVDRKGRTLNVVGEPAEFITPRISSDAQRIAVDVKDPIYGEHLWIYDAVRGTRLSLTPAEPGGQYSPTWSADGTKVAYRTLFRKTSRLQVRAADGSGERMQLGSDHEEVLVARDWSADTRYLVVDISRLLGAAGEHRRLEVWPLAADVKPVLQIDNARGGVLSPDGHWLAYEDTTAGDRQIYVTPFPGSGGRIAVAQGTDVRWRGDGRELFYLAADRTVVAVQVRESSREFSVILSEPLFRLTLPTGVGFYDVTRDGQRFVINTRNHREEEAPLTLVTNWPVALRAGGNREAK